MNKTAKRRFNSVDFLLIMLCLAAVLSLVLQGNLARSLGLEDVGDETEYTLFIPSLNPVSAALFHTGEKITHPDTGEVLGTVRSLRLKNAVSYSLDKNGRVQSTSSADTFDLTLTISGTGKESEKGFLLNGSLHASAGDKLPISPDSVTVFEATVLPNPEA